MRYKIYPIAFAGILFLACFEPTYAQQREVSLQTLIKKREQFYAAQQTKIKVYLQNLNTLSRNNLKQTPLLLSGISESGLPLYRAPLNAGLAITTGVNLLQNQFLGLNLQGENITVGVWDDGLVKNHIELGNRILSKEGSIEQTHATHVVGTILASGINASAKGMAPKAKATTWYFDFDDAEMAALAKTDQSGLLFSNHSYGLVTGWSKVNGVWKWFGDPTISVDEDYRHGFYGQEAKTLDQITFLAPYYTIVWAAGNDRAESGDGTHPADGNGGTGYDCIIPEATGKNIITVGAINKVMSYTNATSVTMSNFSSWGPTDDGRIKPDFVTAGVNVFSLSAAGTNQYVTASGTSMATPNATGSLVLVQELYSKLHGGNFMRASTLKGLAIHTTKESGSFAGPDYSYGWGLLDVGAAGKLLLIEDNESTFVQELSLNNNQKYTLDVPSQAGQKITATLCWTDPNGNPAGASLDPTDPMLVNDLDLRITDGSGASVFPWILDPANPSLRASNGDNFRDNVEKIEFLNPEAKKYTLEVSHKGQLVNSNQKFSLIVTFKSSVTTGSTFYWIGNTGNWNDASHWSLNTGGVSTNTIPGLADNVVFDENSFDGVANRTVNFTADAACKKLTWITDKPAAFALNDHTLNVASNISIAGKDFQVSTKGILKFNATGDHKIDLHSGNMTNASFIFAGGSWTIEGKLFADKFTVLTGEVNISGLQCSLNELNTSTSGILNLTNATISGLTQSTIDRNSTISSDSAVINTAPLSQFNWDGIYYNGKIFVANGHSSKITGSNIIKELFVDAGGELILGNSSIQSLSNITLKGDVNNLTHINSIGSALINFSDHQKLCFDFLDVNSVSVNGNAIVNAGANSTLINTSNWLQIDCSTILFANFDIESTCTNALTIFTDHSSGNISSWSWNFGDIESSNNTSSLKNPVHNYSKAGTYVVTLSITDINNNTESFTQEVQIIYNDAPLNTIVLNGNSLLSLQQAIGYQWYRNGEAVDGAVSRSMDYDGIPGDYVVATKGTECNVISNSFLITALEEETPAELIIQLFPNPANTSIQVNLPQQFKTPGKVTVYNALGQVVLQQNFTESEIMLDVPYLAEGFYHLEVLSNFIVSEKVLIKH